MPRPNAARAIHSEAGLARRVAHERNKLGMSLEGLAKRMTDLGCPINASAIYKIEKGEPPRRITVDELVGFSRAFNLPVEELLLPPDVVLKGEVKSLFEEWERLLQETWDLLTASDERSKQAEAVRVRLFGLVDSADLETRKFFIELRDQSPMFPQTDEERARLEANEKELDGLFKSIERHERKEARKQARRRG